MNFLANVVIEIPHKPSEEVISVAEAIKNFINNLNSNDDETAKQVLKSFLIASVMLIAELEANETTIGTVH